jgi:hypothetical protein
LTGLEEPGNTKGTIMATIAVPLQIKKPVVDESFGTMRAVPRFGPPIWGADSSHGALVERIERTPLPLVMLAFLCAK